MNLKRQLLLLSLLALLLPWAGCQFIRETESALRTSQQQMLLGAARAIADSLSQYPNEFPRPPEGDYSTDAQLYAHKLDAEPVIDGYLEDWPTGESALRTLTGESAPQALTGEKKFVVRYVLGTREEYLYLFAAVQDPEIVYATPASLAPLARPPWADRVILASVTPPYDEDLLSFAAEAPGRVVPFSRNAFGFAREPERAPAREPTIRAVWQDVPGGYQVEARIPRARLGTRVGLVVEDVVDATLPPRTTKSYTSVRPPPLASHSGTLSAIAQGLVQPGMRMIITDEAGWRIASAGSLEGPASVPAGVSRWLRGLYDAVVEDGTPTTLAEPAPDGREQQAYVSAALRGEPGFDWFRRPDGDEAIVAVAQPVVAGDRLLGSVILQQGTDAILSLTNQGLVRLMNLTLIAMLLVGGGLLGYATWLSRRIRRLSIAAAGAADHRRRRGLLPSARASDEIGDLSRSFSSVLGQLGSYNDYLRTLASKLSHELRTPLAIVTSSLENLEQELSDESSRRYTARARGGAERLRRILGAMSEASRVEELMNNVETEPFALDTVVGSAVAGYRDVYPEREFAFSANVGEDYHVDGAPELFIQLLDKLIDNAVSFSRAGDTLRIDIRREPAAVCLDVSNPGPPLPASMHGRLFDSMVSVRAHEDGTHLGLGLYVARVIADGHNGRIEARDIDGGVCFSVWLPVAAAGGEPGRRRTRN